MSESARNNRLSMNKIFRVRIVTRGNEERWFEVDASGRQVLKIYARELQRVELLRKSTGFAPDVIKGRRDGQDLHIDLMESAESISATSRPLPCKACPKAARCTATCR